MIAQPLFAGGANVAGLSLAKGERDLAVAQYQQAIQAAFRDVADALARRGTIRDQMAAQTSPGGRRRRQLRPGKRPL